MGLGAENIGKLVCQDSGGKDLDGEKEKTKNVSVGDGRKESLSNDSSQKFIC